MAFKQTVFPFIFLIFDTMKSRRFILSYFLFLISYLSFSQLSPVGQWREHLPYGSALKTDIVNNKIFCSTPYSLFSFNTISNELQKYSRITGLNETGISSFKYDPVSEILLIAYSNSNIDLLKGNQVYNIDGIKRQAINGDKNIYSIYFSGNLAYLGTGFGIVVINLDKKEIKDTYTIGITGNAVRVSGVVKDGTTFYASTAEGLKKANSSANLIDYTNWTLVNGLSTGGCSEIISFQNKLVLLKNDSLLVNNGSNWNLFYDDAWHIESLHISGDKLLLSETLPNIDGRVLVLNNTGNIISTIQAAGKIKIPKDALLYNNDYYIADLFGGLRKVTGSSVETIIPNSPFEKSSGEMLVSNNKLLVCAGEVNDAWNYTYNRNGLYQFENDYWSFYNQYNFPILDSCYDIITAVADPSGDDIYYGSYSGGLIKLSANNQFTIYKQNTALKPALGDPNSYRVSGLCFDSEHNLWISNYGSPTPLVVKKADNTWKAFTLPFFITENALAQILVDDYDQKWIIAPKGNGLLCYNHGSSIDNIGDDRWKFFRNGVNNGNLPDNEVYCLAKDKDGFIWIGTAKGIAVVQCAQEVFTTGCNAILPIVQNGNFNGYLFGNEQVKTIAVDGANRKWVGTKNGVWLISADGEKVIYRFTENNSPLLSNDIKRITIHPQTGEVFIATFKGLCSFRSTATAGGEKNENVLVFPNPVPPDYNGTIAIKGLINNALVKITELDGRLVYQTKALGGQATWDGRNYKGIKVSSGAYLVLITDETNKEKMVTKIFIVK